MSYPHDLHAPVDIAHPDQPGICDRCGAKWPLHLLCFQYDQRGNTVANLGLRVCPSCYDAVATVLAPIIILGPEGVGSPNPRPYNYAAQTASTGPQLPFSPNNPDLPVVETAEGEPIVSPGGYKQTYVRGFPGI